MNSSLEDPIRNLSKTLLLKNLPSDCFLMKSHSPDLLAFQNLSIAFFTILSALARIGPFSETSKPLLKPGLHHKRIQTAEHVHTKFILLLSSAQAPTLVPHVLCKFKFCTSNRDSFDEQNDFL